MEGARDVTIKLHHRIGKYVQVHLNFALRWIMLSEVTFVAGKHSKTHRQIPQLFQPMCDRSTGNDTKISTVRRRWLCSVLINKPHNKRTR